SPPAPTPSPSPISAARRSSLACVPTCGLPQARSRASPSTSTRRCSSTPQASFASPETIMTTQPDIVIIGSGIGGATMAASLAPSGANILILEAGDHLPDRPENRDQRAIFQRGHFRPKEMWYEA